MSYHQFQMFEKIKTEESQIETSIELSETVNLFIKQNTYFLSNSPNDLILSMCLKIGILKYIVSRRAKLGQIQGGLQRASQDLTKGGLQ